MTGSARRVRDLRSAPWRGWALGLKDGGGAESEIAWISKTSVDTRSGRGLNYFAPAPNGALGPKAGMLILGASGFQIEAVPRLSG